MVNIANLTMETCYKACEVVPSDGQCGICLAQLITPTLAEHNTVVKTKVCDHYFHQDCIDTWFRSATPNLNVCPLDRLVLYGVARVPQTPVNIPSWAPFPGHNVDEHEAVPTTDSRPGSSYSANGGHGITFGALNPGHDFLNPGLTDLFGGIDARQPSQGTDDAHNVDAGPSQGSESQSNDSPYLPNGLTMPGHEEDPQETRRWGW